MAVGDGDRDAAGDGGDDGDGVDDYVGASWTAVASAAAADLLDLDGLYFQAAGPLLLCAQVSHALCPAPRFLCYN